MKLLRGVVQRCGLFLCLCAAFSISSMHKKNSTNMQQCHISPLLCYTCTEMLSQHLARVQKNPHENVRTIIATWAGKQKKCTDCKQLCEHFLQHRDSEELLQQKCAQAKIQRLQFKGMIFLTFLCLCGINPYQEIAAYTSILWIVSGAALAYEAFCNNPALAKKYN